MHSVSKSTHISMHTDTLNTIHHYTVNVNISTIQIIIIDNIDHLKFDANKMYLNSI